MPIQIHSSFPSQHIDPRQIEVWFPPSYDTDPNCHYPVLYMHDGQNVFNPETSTHWVIGEGIVVDYMKNTLPKPGHHKIYFDFGTADTDAPYEPYQIQADEIMRAAGYRPGLWMTQKFPGADHIEMAWRERVHIPLEFLLGKSS